MRIPVLVALLALLPALAGCTGRGAEPMDPEVAPSVSSSASFEVASITIRPENDTERGILYEDDGAAVVRYVVRQPASAPRETAFVSYLLNGRIVDVQQITLAPATERAFERRVEDLRGAVAIEVEVRAGSSTGRAEADVARWPRAGVGSLAFGPLTIRADYGLLEQDGRVLVNLTLVNDGPEQTFRDFRVKMLCVAANGTTAETRNVRVEPPTTGNASGVDVVLEDCKRERYGFEFKANTDDGSEIFSRLLLVPRDWTPTPEA